MKDAIVPAVAASIALFSTASGAAATSKPHTACPTFRVFAALGQPAHATEPCATADITPYVYVNGHELRTADLSHHSTVATFYGEGTVVQLTQKIGHTESLVAVSTRRARIKVRIAATPQTPSIN